MGAAAQQGVGLEGDVPLEGDVGVDPGGRGVEDRHPGPHPGVEGAPVELAVQRGELDPVVDTLGLPGVGDGQGTHPLAVAARDRDDVGDVELALRVVGRQALERVAQRLGLEGVDAGVELADPQLVLGGVLLLHDPGDRPRRAAQDPAVAGRVVEVAGQQRDGVGLGVMDGDEVGERLAGEQRGVAVRHDDGALQARQVGEGALDGVAGAQLLLLHDRARLGRDVGEVGDDLVAAVADDDDEMGGLQRAGSSDGVVDQGPATDRVQDLRDRRLHPGALAGSEDDHGGRSSGGHAVSAPRRGGGREVVHCRGYPPFTPRSPWRSGRPTSQLPGRGNRTKIGSRGRSRTCH